MRGRVVGGRVKRGVERRIFFFFFFRSQLFGNTNNIQHLQANYSTPLGTLVDIDRINTLSLYPGTLIAACLLDVSKFGTYEIIASSLKSYTDNLHIPFWGLLVGGFSMVAVA